MLKNRFFRSAVFGVVIAGMLPALSGNAFAFSGGVTTYSTANPGTLNEIITRTRTVAATTAEYNQTYQRTMKVAATAVAVRTSAISIARGSIGAILAVAAVAQLAIDLKGIWGPDPNTGKSTVITLDKVPCDTIGSGCVTYSIQYSRLPFVYSSRQACLDEIGRIAKTASASSYTYITSDKYSCDVTEVKGTYKGVATWAMDTSVGAADQSSNPRYATDEELDSRLQQPDRIVPFVKALDDAGSPVQFADPEKEVLPQAIPLPPIVVTFPDGTTKTERASLVPYLAPDETVHWKRPSEITTTYPPNASGAVPPPTITRTDNAPPIAGTDPQVNAPPTKVDIDTCGLPGKPPCKIDETGTPKFDPKTMELDKTTLDSASKSQRDTVASTTDKVSMFNPFSQFFILPPLSSCTPIAMPMYAGQQIASMDVCPAAEWLRGLMGFVWAAAGFAFVFRTVQDVI